VNQDTLLKIIALLVVEEDGPEIVHRDVLSEFAILLLVPPAPFKNSSIEQVTFANEVLLAAPASSSEEDQALSNAKQSIACILACQNHSVAMKIFDTKKGDLQKLTSKDSLDSPALTTP